MMNDETDRAWSYHNSTKHSYWSVRTTPHYLDWGNRPLPFKIYPNLEPIGLPQDLIQTGEPALKAIVAGDHQTGPAKPNIDQLASILYYSAGVTKKTTYPGGNTIYFRAAACAGALYPIEVYLICGDLEGLPAGVYHFNPGDFALRRLRSGDYRAALVQATAGEPAVASSPVLIVYTAISWRSTWKYRDRAYRYHFWDCGMIVANCQAMAAAHRLPASLVMGFVDAEVNKLVGIDGERELALAILALGSSRELSPPPHVELDELDLEVLPLSQSEVDYPSICEMHRASSLEQPIQVSRWRSAAFDQATSPARSASVQLPKAGTEPLATIEEVIQRRASTRRFARKTIGLEDLSTILWCATRGVPADFISDRRLQLNDIYLVANRVEGVESGAYLYDKEAHALEMLKAGEFSEKAAYLSLEQELGGDASVTLFFIADLDRVLRAMGNRGYRAVQMEAAIIGGRVYLAAYALKRGATGLTFYDDEVTDFFAPNAPAEGCIFEIAIGVAGRRPMY